MGKNFDYFSEFVYLRAIAILAVISIHVSSYFTEMSGINFLTLIYMSIDTFSYFAVSLFVCISGFMLYNKYKWPFSLKQFYKKRFTSVVPQYTVFFFLAILSTYIYSTVSQKIWNFGAKDIINMYLTGVDIGHLWFFVLIIQLYILYPIVEKIFTKSVENNKSLELLIFLFFFPLLYHFLPLPEYFFSNGKTPLFFSEFILFCAWNVYQIPIFRY